MALEFTDDKGTYILCPVCNSKRYRVGEPRVFMGKKIWAYEDCDNCKKEAEKREKQKRIAIEKSTAIQKRKNLMESLEHSNIGRKYYNVAFNTLDSNISPTFSQAWNRLQKFCNVIDTVMEKNLGVYLYGKNGRGKTALSVAVIKKLILAGYSCYLTNMIELGQNIINNRVDLLDIQECDFLVIDDLGTEKLEKNGNTNWLSTVLYDLINYRDKNLKLTIITSNFSISQLLEAGVEKKVVDRVQALCPVKIMIDTPLSYRLKQEREIPF